MTNRLEPPILEEHDHHLEPSEDGDNGHRHGHALTVIEEPLDPASQSLSDALRASFRILKVVMLIVVVLFLLSGIYRVDQNEVVIVSRLGVLQPPSEPGLNWAFPYPIDQRISLQTSPQTLPVDTYWLNLSDADRVKPLSELYARGQGLDPAVDGALLTGDHAIMHLKLIALYKVEDPVAFTRNVSDSLHEGERLLRSVLHNATIAEAAKSTADEVLKSPAEVAERVRRRAQAALIAMDAGVSLDYLSADKSHYPLQTKDAFLRVSEAENEKRDAIQGALSEQAKKLNGVAGEAWQKLYEQIQLLDQHKDGTEHEAARQQIDEILTEQAAGEAGGKIRLAQAQKQQVIAETQSRVAAFEALLAGYQKDPELVRHQLRRDRLTELFDQKGVTKWFLPAGAKQVILSFNKDPVQVREAEREAMTRKTEAPR